VYCAEKQVTQQYSMNRSISQNTAISCKHCTGFRFPMWWDHFKKIWKLDHDFSYF